MQSAGDKVRFGFVTQCPRDDGCGVFVLQMLTGKPYDEVAGLIDWGARTNHYTTWTDLLAVLPKLGWHTGALTEATAWRDITGVAIVHVEPDHFILYDGENGHFYDPSQLAGPNLDSNWVPISYVKVLPPELEQDNA